ncbi:MAG: conjugal transfer protein TraF [Betaproteobacteria bacterium]|nr:conjugal transfer protein TraF [Betaproteobacteria bacterium]
MSLERRELLRWGAIGAGLALGGVPQAAFAGVLSQVGERYGLFYFFAASCKACDTQSPIVARLRDEGLPVMAVSEDGGISAYFPKYVVDTGQRERMGISGKETPTMALFDTVTRRSAVLGTGVIAHSTLRNAILRLAEGGF